MTTRNGKHDSVERKPGECFQWRAKGQCTTGCVCSFRHDKSKRGRAAQSSSPAPKQEILNDLKSSLKGESLRGRSPISKEVSKTVERLFLGENCTNPSRIF